MILAALALAAASASPMPDLDAALVNYQALVVEAQRTGDTSWLPGAATTVCMIAYRYTLTRQDTVSADVVLAYRGPNAERLRLSCAVYFQARAR